MPDKPAIQSNTQEAINLLRALRETTDPLEIERQKESWAALEQALISEPSLAPPADAVERAREMLAASLCGHENCPDADEYHTTEFADRIAAALASQGAAEKETLEKEIERLLAAARRWRDARTAYYTNNSLTCREYGIAGDELAVAISGFDNALEAARTADTLPDETRR